MPLVVHFLNVGEGDCTIIEFPSGHVGMVDISNVKTIDPDTRAELLHGYDDMKYVTAKLARSPEVTALQDAYVRRAAAPTTDALEYFDAHIGYTKDIFRLIVTHPHMDHISGLHRLIHHEPKDVVNFWHSGLHNFDLDHAEWGGWKYDREDWETYKQLRISDSDPKSLQKQQGDEGVYWTQDGLSLWAPTDELKALAIQKNNPNILSAVLKVSHAGRSILLGGDATADDTWPLIYPYLDLTGIDVLKASHHGRNSGYHQPSVKEMSPWLTITSVGQKEHDATEKYRQYSDYTVSTRFTGDIAITIEDDGTLVYPDVLEEHWRPRKG